MITPVAQSPSPIGRVLPGLVLTGCRARRGAMIEAQAEEKPKPGEATPPPGEDSPIRSVPPTPIADRDAEPGRLVSPSPDPLSAVRSRGNKPGLPGEVAEHPLEERVRQGIAPPAVRTEEPQPLPTIDEIRQHRGEPVGEANARFDLNGDGRIDVGDILYLRNLQNRLVDESTERVRGEPVKEAAATLDENPPLPTIEEIRQHRGEPVDELNARYDLNGDGRIDVGDILYLRKGLNSISQGRVDTQA